MPTIPITGPAKRTVGLSLNCPDRTAMTSPSANSPSPHQRIWRTSLEGPATGGGAGFGGSPSEDGEGGTSITSQLYQRPGAPKSLKWLKRALDPLKADRIVPGSSEQEIPIA